MSSLPISYLKDIRQGLRPADLATKTCFTPKKVWVFDSVSGTRRLKYVPCNKCLRCQDSKRDEFVSRMFLHSLSFKHVYFITLTYGSYNLNVFTRHPFKDDWLLTHPVCDSYNSTHKPRWTPTLVIQSHVTKFLKRLRKQLGFEISYVAAGEVGDTWQRPHHHLIIYSNKPITHKQFIAAWSLDCVSVDSTGRDVVTYNGRQKGFRFRFPIGRVDYADLVANGTMDWKAARTKDGSALKCFSYVAKYVCKTHDPLPLFALKRFRKAYDDCQTVLDYNCIVGKRDIECYSKGAFGDDDFIFTGRVDTVDDYVDDEFYQFVKSNIQRFQMLNDVKAFNFYYRPTNFNLSNYETKQVHINGRTLESCDFNQFVKLFSCYFTFSRATPIGALYFEEKYSQFEKGDYALPKPFGKSLAFPSYFYSLLARKKSPFFFRKTRIGSMSLVKCNLSHVYEFYSRFIENKAVLYDTNFRALSPIYPIKKVERPVSSGLIDPLHPQFGTLLDVTCYNKLGRVHYYYDFDSDLFNGYLFDKHQRDFVLFDSITRQDFCLFIIRNIEQLFNEHDSYIRSCELKFELIDKIVCDPDSDSVIQNYIQLRRQRSNDYKSKHLTIDKQ